MGPRATSLFFPCFCSGRRSRVPGGLLGGRVSPAGGFVMGKGLEASAPPHPGSRSSSPRPRASPGSIPLRREPRSHGPCALRAWVAGSSPWGAGGAGQGPSHLAGPQLPRVAAPLGACVHTPVLRGLEDRGSDVVSGQAPGRARVTSWGRTGGDGTSSRSHALCLRLLHPPTSRACHPTGVSLSSLCDSQATMLGVDTHAHSGGVLRPRCPPPASPGSSPSGSPGGEGWTRGQPAHGPLV